MAVTDLCRAATGMIMMVLRSTGWCFVLIMPTWNHALALVRRVIRYAFFSIFYRLHGREAGLAETPLPQPIACTSPCAALILAAGALELSFSCLVFTIVAAIALAAVARPAQIEDKAAVTAGDLSKLVQ